jgi:hypothetical protein
MTPRPSRLPIFSTLAVAGLLAAGSPALAADPPAEAATTTPAPVSRARLEVVRVDDTADPFAAVEDAALPLGSGITLGSEPVSLGPGQSATHRFARVTLRDGETSAQARARLLAWLGTVSVPAGERFALEEVLERDESRGDFRVAAIRSLLLTGDAVLRTEDIASAEVQSGLAGVMPEPHVALTFTADAAGRLATLSRDWMLRRMALVVDGEVKSAPVFKSVITGGRVSLTLGHADPAERAAEASRLVHALLGR